MGSPRRTCIGCRRVQTPAGLVRVTVGPTGAVLTGPGRHGRGAWLCAGSEPCFEQAWRRRAFTRALRATVAEDELIELRGRLFPTMGAAQEDPAVVLTDPVAASGMTR